MKRTRVLIVDDEPAIREPLSASVEAAIREPLAGGLEDAGFATHAVPTGESPPIEVPA